MLLGSATAMSTIVGHAPAAAATGTCDGVIVVVDFTDLGGELQVGCAEGDQASGRDALVAAGFTSTDSQPGFVCAINSMPDPCPETFQGSFWSYWHSAPDGEWASYQVGADSSTPAHGEIEGWRYNDGSTPPGLAPSDAASYLPEIVATPEATAPGADEQVTSADDSGLNQRGGEQSLILLVAAVGFFALIVALIIAFVVRQRRGDADESRTPGSRD